MRTVRSLNTKQTYLTPFNIITGIIIVVGLILTIIRFTSGLATVTNLDSYNPWGIWIGFDLLTGVALAAGGYTTSAAVYIFGMKKYHAAVRPAILTGFLGYSLVVIALMYDVGRPYRLPYPMFVQQGTQSVLFEVGLCVGIYLTVLFLEFSSAPLEWLGIKKLARIVSKLTILLTILGVILSTMHQSSLGSLFLLAEAKLHPLWYSPFLPVFFFVSSIAAGLSMVIVEGGLSHKYFAHKMDKAHLETSELVVLGFGKSASIVLAGYFIIKVFGVALDGEWSYLFTGYGALFLLELFGFVLFPSVLYMVGVREKRFGVIRFAAAWTVFGIMFNRMNISWFAFNYHLPDSLKYFPSFSEIMISVFLITAALLVFRFIVTRMPILYEHPDFPQDH